MTTPGSNPNANGSGGVLTCPNCGQPLAAYIGEPGEAPWLSTTCALSWHPSELGAAVRESWDPVTRSHGYQATKVRSAVAADIATARAAGVNIPAEHLGVLTDAQLADLDARGGIAAGYRAQVDQVRAGRGKGGGGA